MTFAPQPSRRSRSKDLAPDLPVEANQLTVDRERRARARRGDAGLERSEELGVIGRQLGGTAGGDLAHRLIPERAAGANGWVRVVLWAISLDPLISGREGPREE